MDNKMIGERIKQLRKSHSLTQTELGELIGVTKSTIAKYEHGIVTNLKRESIQILADHFNVSPAYFFGGEMYVKNTKSELIDIINSLTEDQQNALLTIAKAMVK